MCISELKGNYNSVYLLGRKLTYKITNPLLLYMVYECYYFIQGLQMIMSVLQEVKGLTKKLYFIIYTSSRKTSFHAKFQAQCLHCLPVLT